MRILLQVDIAEPETAAKTMVRVAAKRETVVECSIRVVAEPETLSKRIEFMAGTIAELETVVQTIGSCRA